jgi:hypothetical protein
MQPSHFAAFRSLALSAGGRTHFHMTDDLAYQATTVAAILLVLGTLWVF